MIKLHLLLETAISNKCKRLINTKGDFYHDKRPYYQITEGIKKEWADTQASLLAPIPSEIQSAYKLDLIKFKDIGFELGIPQSSMSMAKHSAYKKSSNGRRTP
jgi:hypothetical protein